MQRSHFVPTIALAAAALAWPVPAAGQEQIQPGDLVDFRIGWPPPVVRGWQYQGGGAWDVLRNRCCLALFRRDRTYTFALAWPESYARREAFPATIRVVRTFVITLQPDELPGGYCSMGDRIAFFVAWSEGRRRLRYVFTDGNGFTVEERDQEGSARPCDFGVDEFETIG
ncbi:MAG TPA: hypothetical protein VMS43_12615 [Allosphingosinicella sp.]|nr:hypothetical protein [Allosphingosinicella sp.]